MARPYDPREEAAAQAFADLPEEWQSDGWIQTLYGELMRPSNSWDESYTWYEQLKDYVAHEYNADWDDYFDWGVWRANYNAFH